MAREFSVIVGIDAGRARTGARQFKQGADQVSRSSQRMTRNLRTTNKSAIALITTIGRIRGVASLAFAGFLGVGGIGAVVKTLAQFEAGMKRVEALLGDRAVGGAMRALTERARELGATTAFTATQAAEGMQFLTLAGFDALETFQAIGPALQLAQAGMLGLGEAADIVSNIMQGFNIDASRTQEVVDALAFVATRSNTSIRQLGEAMKFVAPVAGAVGLAVDETAAALGLLGNSGLQASLAGTSLRRVLSGLLNPSKEAVKVFSDMGLRSEDLVEALQDPTKGLVFVIKQLEDAGIGAAEAFTLFGQRGAPGLLSLIGQTDKLEKFNEQMESIEGTARDIGTVMIDNLQGDARIAISAVQEAIIRLGEAGLLEWLRDATQAFTAFVRGLADIDQSLEGTSEKVRKWAAAGVFMRENVDLLRRALITFVVFLNRTLLVSVATAVGRFALLGITVAGLAGPFAVASAGAVLLKGALTALKAVLSGLLVGALVVAAGALLDWVLFSEDAEAQNKKTGESFDRLAQTVETAAFKFATLTEQQRQFAIRDVTLLITEQEIALTRMTTQVKNAATAQERIREAEEKVAAATEAANATTTERIVVLGAMVDVQTTTEESLQGLKKAEEELMQAELLLQSTNGATASGLADLKAEIEDNKLRLQAWVAVVNGTFPTVEAYIASLNGAKDANKQFSAELRDQLGLSGTQAIALTDLIKEYTKTEQEIAELSDSLDILNIVLADSEAVEKSLGLATGTLAKVTRELTFDLNKAKNELSPLQKAQEKWADKIQDSADKLDKYSAANTSYLRALRDAERALDLGIITLQQYNQEVKNQKAILEDTKKTLDESCESTETLKKCQTEAAKAMEAVWDQAWRNIQDTFADAFKGAFDSFSEFSDRLLDAVKNMIAELLSAKLLGGLKDALGGIFGGGSAGGGGGFLDVIKKAFSPGGGGLAGIFKTGFAKILDIGKKFVGILAQFGKGILGSFGIGSGGAGLAGAAGGLVGGGIIGVGSGTVVDSILGGRGNQSTTTGLSAAGGALGFAIGGPLGAIVGGAIGSFASNLLGGAKELAAATVQFTASSEGFTANLEKIVTKQRSFFRGRSVSTTDEALDVTSFDQALAGIVDSVSQIAGSLGVDAADALSGFRFSREIDVKGKTEEEIQALLSGVFNDTLVALVREFVDNAEGLSDRLRNTVRQFQGSTEEFLTAFNAAATIDIAFLIKPVADVQEAIAESNKSLATTYGELLVAYNELIATYDGSLPALEELAVATQIVVTAQAELASALIMAGDAISNMFQSSAQTIEEALLNEEQLFTLRKTQIDELVAQASASTDPAELQRLAEEINSLGLAAFNILDESQQGEQQQEFIDFFNELDELFGDQIDMGLNQITEDNNALNQDVADTMTAAAQAQIDAARAAEQTFVAWRGFIEGQGPGRFTELSR